MSVDPTHAGRDRQDLASALHELRTAAGLSGDRLARRCGMSQSKVSRIETGRLLPSVVTTCQTHGAAGFTNLLVTKENGVIVLNPHLANCCVLRLDEQAATELLGILEEWLG